MAKEKKSVIDTLQNLQPAVQALLLALPAIYIVYLCEGHMGFYALGDEGYLWYDAQRAFLGEVPIRDFQSYDPGRYYWLAAVMHLYGNSGIIALRIGCTLFKAIGLFVAVWLLIRSIKKPDIAYSAIAAATLLLWMHPLYYVFNFTCSIVLVGALTLLVENPSPIRYFQAGACVGLVAVFGLNHGLYGILGNLCTIAYLAFGKDTARIVIKNLAIWGMGIAAGYLPVGIMIAFIPGFGKAFQNDVLFILGSKDTNIPLPIHWPWNGGGILGFYFIAMLAYGILGIVYVFWLKSRNREAPSVAIASVFLALPYAHYTFSRPDMDHTADGIFPFLIGSFALLATLPEKKKWFHAKVLFFTSAFLLVFLYPWLCFFPHACVKADVAGSELLIPPSAATNLEVLGALAKQHAPGDQDIISVPWGPGLYALLGKKSPLYETSSFGCCLTFQRNEIDRLKAANPRIAIIYDRPLQGEEKYLYRYTRPLINKYILDNFIPLAGYTFVYGDGVTGDPAYKLYIRKDIKDEKSPRRR